MSQHPSEHDASQQDPPTPEPESGPPTLRGVAPEHWRGVLERVPYGLRLALASHLEDPQLRERAMSVAAEVCRAELAAQHEREQRLAAVDGVIEAPRPEGAGRKRSQ